MGAAQCQSCKTSKLQTRCVRGSDLRGVDLTFSVLLGTSPTRSIWEIVSFSTKQAVLPHLLSSPMTLK